MIPVSDIISGLPSLVCALLFAGGILSFMALSGKRAFRRLADAALLGGCAGSLALFSMMWLHSRHIPLSDTFETLLFATLLLEILVIALRRQDNLLRGTAMTFTAALALTASLMASRRADSPLMPVLDSPWLSVHVSLVMTAYALFALTFVAAATALLSPAKGERMRRVSLSALYPAEYLLAIGIITGSVWADVSWGRYWSWDPKETLALATFLIYALPLHPSIRLFRNVRAYHIYMLLAILAAAATYFGVNFLPSLHAYN